MPKQIRQTVLPLVAALIWGTAFVMQKGNTAGALTFNAARSVIAGEHWLNGGATENCIDVTYFPERSHLLFHVYGCAATNDTIVRYLGSDRLGATKTGGWRVGEILMYTNVLTRAERARVNRYLVKKWLGSDDCDAGAVMVAAGAGTLGVPGGHTANVRRIAAEGGRGGGLDEERRA